ncbi:MAG TPA: FAD/NAD(P)-binding oxidoreductase [Candidatus Saccharimonadales bacterium]|nr:FAD/NAD(P)-binding oxidoreductase [Candidatus Saccharimonadales bacterium]
MSARRHVMILGGGTGGTITANRLRRTLPESIDITVVDGNNDHLYQPGLLFVPFGLTEAEHLIRPRDRQLHHGIEYIGAVVERVDIAERQVHFSGGRSATYDVLVIATGAVLMPEETDGLDLSGAGRNIFTFYSLDGARALRDALEAFTAGRIVVNVVDMPIKCPVAPLEFCFLADWFFRERGTRDAVDLTYVTPLDGVFTKPVASKRLGELLTAKGINVVTEFNTGTVDGDARKLVSYDDREVPFDLAVVVPLHGGAAYVGRSDGLGDELNFIATDAQTLQSKVAPNIFVIGDAAGLPVSKAGSVTHFEGEVLTENIRRFLAGEPLDASFDGHTNCFIETGFGKAALIDFNYDTEPLPGHYPGRVGLPLLKESHLNHLGKLMFEWFYWHALLPGHSIPGISSEMPVAGKQHATSVTG